jgi:hypothetical protein
MEKLKITLFVLGSLKFDVNLHKVQEWRSELFEIEHVNRLHFLPDSESESGWHYSDKQLKKIIGDTSSFHVVLALINAELENNYYGRRIGKNIYILSLYETGHIILKNDLGLEQFIVQNLYYVTAVYYKFRGNIPLSNQSLTHQDIRSCLFDFNSDKEDIPFSLGKATICDDCKADFDSTFVPDRFVETLRNELKRIKKPIYFRIRDFIKRRPVVSLFIAILATIILNLVSNFLYTQIDNFGKGSRISRESEIFEVPKDSIDIKDAKRDSLIGR